MKLEVLDSLLESKYNSYNSGFPFLEYAPVYVETNEILREIFKIFDVRDKDVLCVTGGGDFALNALSLGANSVVSFDYNKFAKYVLALKEATILTYADVDSFKSFFSKSSKDFLARNNFKAVSSNLDDDSYKFWSYVYDCVFKNCLLIGETMLIRGTLTENLDLQEEYNLYYQQEYYSILRERLKHELVVFKDLNIVDLKDVTDKYFDVIYLSNVLQYYYDIKGLEGQDLVHKFIMKDVFSKLKDNGLVGVCYCYFDKMIELDNKGYDINSYLLRHYPDIYTLETFPSITNSYNEGISLCRKKTK